MVYDGGDDNANGNDDNGHDNGDGSGDTNGADNDCGGHWVAAVETFVTSSIV